MRRKPRACRFIRRCSHALSRLSALSLIVLILLPFTAPFPTFQLEGQSGSQPYDESLRDVKDKVSSDAQVGVSGHAIVPPAPSLAVAIDLVQPNRSILAEFQHAVLRI